MSDCILIIDDDETLTKMLAKWLHAKGYDVQIAVSGRDGLEKARKSQPDLIVLDGRRCVRRSIRGCRCSP